MTQCTNPPTHLNRFWLRSLFLQSMSCIGIFSLLSGNLVLAQTEATIDAIVPTNQDSQPAIGAVAPIANSVPALPARWQRLRQKLRSTPVKQQQNQTAVPNSPAIVRLQKVQKHYSATQLRQSLLKPQAIAPPTAQVSGSSDRSFVEPQNNNLTTSFNSRAGRSVKPNSDSAIENNGAYIDPTEYKIGATTGYEAPKSVVLSERLTGCKAVAQAGLSGSICSKVSPRRVQMARLTRNVETHQKSAFVKSGIRPIKIGPISVSASGFRVSSNPQTKRSVLSYYYQDSKAKGQLRNINAGFMFPLTIPAPITSLFGWRIHPITGDRRFHAGTDLGAPLGTPVLAAYAGNVEIADNLGGYGLTVVLNHNKLSEQTLYGHLSEIFVQPGEWVQQGTVIGRVGSTGNSTGPHLHFETRQLTREGWVAIDPGTQLEYSFAQLMDALRTAHAKLGDRREQG